MSKSLTGAYWVPPFTKWQVRLQHFAFDEVRKRMWQKGELAKRKYWRACCSFRRVGYDDQPVSVHFNGAPWPLYEMAQWIPPVMAVKPSRQRAPRGLFAARLNWFVVMANGVVFFDDGRTVALTGRLFIIRMPKGPAGFVRRPSHINMMNDCNWRHSMKMQNVKKRGEAFWHHSWRIRRRDVSALEQYQDALKDWSSVFQSVYMTLAFVRANGEL